MNSQSLEQSFLEYFQNKDDIHESLLSKKFCAIAERHFNVGEFGKSVDFFLLAIKNDPADPLIHRRLGLALIKERRFDEAIKAYQTEASLSKDDVTPFYRIALLLERMNKLEALEEMAEIMKERKYGYQYFLYLSALLKYRRHEYRESLNLLNEILREETTDELLMNRHFLKGRLLDKLKDYQGAFSAFADGNDLQKKIKANKGLFEENRKYIERIKSYREVFTVKNISARVSKIKPADFSPVFLVGFPRSGTTMLEQILHSHPGIDAIEEREFFLDFHRAIKSSDDIGLFFQNLSEKDIGAFRDAYLARLNSTGKRTGNVLIDKLPMNIVHLGLIYLTFPNAKIIVLLRDPRDSILSNFMQQYGIQQMTSSFLSVGKAVSLYIEAMKTYLHYRETLPLKFYEVRYEDLIDDFDTEMSGLLNFIDVPWNDAIRDFQKTALARNISTPSYSQVIQPLNKSAIGRWKNYRENLQPYISELAPFLKTFKYQED